MFELPRPQFIQPPPLSEALEGVLDRTSSPAKNQELRKLTLQPLAPTNQRDGKAVGFFDQGLKTGATLLMTPIVTGGAVLAYYGVSAIVRRYR
jgi:hypothetical protein